MGHLSSLVIADLYNELLEAWNGGDVDSFYFLFHDDGLIVNMNGDILQDREHIREKAASLFACYECRVHQILKLVDLTENCFLLLAMVGNTLTFDDQCHLHSLIISRTKGSWKVAFMQQILCRPDHRMDIYAPMQALP